MGRSQCAPHLDGYVALLACEAFLTGLCSHVRWFDVTSLVSGCCDPADNKFVASALDADAELLVSSDPHLTTMHPWQGMPIVLPVGFLAAVA